MTTSGPRKKIAILGGGMAALAAAFELTRPENHPEEREITVYQMGHRLGGKGASGRNAAHAHRIEEHGLHIFMGFYENTFDILRACYAELGRRPDEPLATVEKAFAPHDFIVVTEDVEGQWKNWPLPFPPQPGRPGEGGVTLPTVPGYLRSILDWLRTVWSSSPDLAELAPGLDERLRDIDDYLTASAPATLESVPATPGHAPTRAITPDHQRRRLDHLVDGMMKHEGLEATRAVGFPSFPAFTFLDLAGRFFGHALSGAWERISWLVDRFRAWLSVRIEHLLASSDNLRRSWVMLDLGITAVLGMIADGLVKPPHDFFALDGEDLDAWLGRHGASEATRRSALVRSLYNLGFSLPGEIAAGTAIQGVLRMVFTYRGSIFYKMQAGMGDTVFSPLYLVLKRRGVRFEFFHRVDRIAVSPDGKSVAAVELGRQVTVKGGDYHPLYDVEGLPCWPSEPRYEAIEEGEALRASGENLESWWTSWPDAGRVRLEAGRDFDTVILGISAGALGEIGAELVQANPRFAEMVSAVKTAQTQAAQIWLGSSFEQLGWKLPPPVLDGYAEPFDTWADMTHLIDVERWPGGEKPRALAYLCSRLQDEEERPSRGPSDYPIRQAARARSNVARWLETRSQGLWPGAAPGGAGTFDWSLLVDPRGKGGAERLEAQYSQAAYSPSERYVLSVPGSSRRRLRAEESGFERLVLAGDWVLTAMSAGCIEAATMAGMQASRAISGHPAVIVGDLPPLGHAPPNPLDRPAAAPPVRRAVAAAARPVEPAGGAADLPLYVERGGDVVIRHPLSMQGTISSSFLLPADRERLGALCDRLLVGPARGAAHYVPAGPFVMLVCADIARGQATEPPDHDKGWLSERDVAFWVPVLAGRREGEGFVAERLLWLLTYTFVDNVAAMATGREVFGFPKEHAAVVFPRDQGSAGRFTVDTLVIRRFGLDARAESARLLTVEPAGGSTRGVDRPWASIEQGFHELGDKVLGMLHGIDAPVLSARAVAEHMIKGYLDGSIEMVFLKQFRDVRDPSRACYQAVIEARARVDAWRSGGFLPPHVVTIEAADSHPIVAELGLSGRSVESIAGVRLDYDFTVERGVVIGG
jgi:uncharacterized protein with NAD-binding domain and iron-sulfur cluster